MYRHARPAPDISPYTLSELCERPWLGKIRQLQHEIERAFVFSDGELIRPEDLTECPVRVPTAPPVEQSATLEHPDRQFRGLKSVVDEIQNEEIREAIIRAKGNKKKAAASLGISRSLLFKKLGEVKES